MAYVNVALDVALWALACVVIAAGWSARSSCLALGISPAVVRAIVTVVLCGCCSGCHSCSTLVPYELREGGNLMHYVRMSLNVALWALARVVATTSVSAGSSCLALGIGPAVVRTILAVMLCGCRWSSCRLRCWGISRCR